MTSSILQEGGVNFRIEGGSVGQFSIFFLKSGRFLYLKMMIFVFYVFLEIAFFLVFRTFFLQKFALKENPIFPGVTTFIQMQNKMILRMCESLNKIVGPKKKIFEVENFFITYPGCNFHTFAGRWRYLDVKKFYWKESIFINTFSVSSQLMQLKSYQHLKKVNFLKKWQKSKNGLFAI